MMLGQTNIKNELDLKKAGLTAWDWTYHLGSFIYFMARFLPLLSLRLYSLR
jgi:hypothetical protein